MGARPRDILGRVDDLPVLAFESQKEWGLWLREHHRSAPGVWLKFAKKASGIPSVTYGEAVEEALRYGWIDSQKRAFDERFWLQRFTERRPRSIWSKVNREKATELIESGRMRAAGLRQVERAKADGRWDAAYDSGSTATVPDDLQRELDRNPEAAAFFATLDAANRYAILWRVQTARKAETRASRIQKFVQMLSEHKRPHD